MRAYLLASTCIIAALCYFLSVLIAPREPGIKLYIGSLIWLSVALLPLLGQFSFGLVKGLRRRPNAKTHLVAASIGLASCLAVFVAKIAGYAVALGAIVS